MCLNICPRRKGKSEAGMHFYKTHEHGGRGEKRKRETLMIENKLRVDEGGGEGMGSRGDRHEGGHSLCCKGGITTFYA